MATTAAPPVVEQQVPPHPRSRASGGPGGYPAAVEATADTAQASTEITMAAAVPGSIGYSAEVSFAPQNVTNLGQLSEMLGLSYTDVVNHAVAAYAFVQQELMDGGTLWVQASDGTFQRALIR